MQLTNALLSLLPLTALVAAAPAGEAEAARKPYVVSITGLPAKDFPDPEYVTYAKNFFGDLTLQPTTDKSAAIRWSVGPKADLVSGSKQSISLTPPYARPQSQSINYVAYNGTQGTYVKKRGLEVVNRSPDFASWQLCTSQYGLSLLYETPGYNNSNAGRPFPCYPVKFSLKE